MRPGRRNLITDVAGLAVGQAEDTARDTGVTVLTAATPFTAAVHVAGGAPGTRETDLLAPENIVPAVDALVLSGGSAFGLDAAAGVVQALAAAGRGFEAAGHRVPIVPAAILFDLASGDRDDRPTDYRALGVAAHAGAGGEFALGSVGAGTGATVAGLKGGLGSASCITAGGHAVGALVAVNAVGSVTQGDGPHFHAAPFEIDGEFGGLGPAPQAAGAVEPRTKLGARPGTSTTLAIVATDATLTKAEAKRLAIAAHDGIARAIQPAHTPLDGDLVFAAATGARPLGEPIADQLALGHAAAACLSRAVARGVFHARAAPAHPARSWRQLFGEGENEA